MFYLDDGLLVGPAARVADAFGFLCNSFRDMGMSVNLSKCAAWGPGTDLLAQAPEDHPIRGVPVTDWCLDSGLKMLGVPIGRSGEHGLHEALWKKKVTELEFACTELLGVPDP